MTWLPATLYEAAARAAYQEAADLAEWSSWLPFEDACRAAPREPGVYLLREPTGQIRYAGMAGERAGSGRPQGLHGRLSVYWSGKAAVSGFGEAALDRAVADPDWVEQQLERLRASGPKRRRNGLVLPSCGSALRCPGRYAPTRTAHQFLRLNVAGSYPTGENLAKVAAESVAESPPDMSSSASRPQPEQAPARTLR